MERLTDNKINGWTFEETIKTAENLMETEKNMFKWDVLRHLRDFAENYREKLADYEDLEEQDRLLKLPCKVGDVVYSFLYGEIVELKVISVEYQCCAKIRKNIIVATDEFEATFNFQDVGNKVFLTKSEAEAKLKELGGGEDE